MFQSDHRPTLAVKAPTADTFTDYDEAHLAIYLSLLHASGEGMSDGDIARNIFGIDPALEPARARDTLRSHLQRARWMAERGYHHMLGN
jgi:hypothetical protein